MQLVLKWCFKERMASISKREWQRKKVFNFIFVSLLIIYPKSIVKAFKAISSGICAFGITNMDGFGIIVRHYRWEWSGNLRLSSLEIKFDPV